MYIETRKKGGSKMKVKKLFNSEWVRICKADEGVYWSGYAYSILKNVINIV
jgi:hypothetical protein